MDFKKQPHIGFIGQGYVGKNYADDFEARGYPVVRYSLEEPYKANKEKIAECEIVFIAVPTPTKPGKGCDICHVEDTLSLVGKGKTAVIKSTVPPGTTEALQKKYPDRTVLFSPEFLSERTAAEEAANPFALIIGIPVSDAEHEKAAKTVHAVSAKAPFTLTCTSAEAEVIKYAHNINGCVQVIFFNLLYDLVKAHGGEWEPVQKALSADPYVCPHYTTPVHKGGRGAGGHCFIKDFAAFEALYAAALPNDERGKRLLSATAEKNRALLTESGKDAHILADVYGAKGT